MTNAELKKIMEESGLSAEEISKFQDKFDAEKITETVENASCASEAFKALYELYPELEIEKLKKQCDFMMTQIAAAVEESKKKGPVELSKEELENVAGGGIFSDIGNWFKDNWKAILIGAAVIVAGAAISAAMLGVGGALLSGVSAVLFGTDTFLAGAAFGASVGATAGAVFGGIGGIFADALGLPKDLADKYWS